MDVSIVEVAITGLAAIAAVCSVLIAVHSLRNTRKIAEAQILVRFREKYSEDQMLSDLRTLRKWKSDHGERFAEIWHELRLAENPEALEVDGARRRVGQYFVWIRDLYDGGFITPKMADMLVNVRGLDLVYEVVEPLDEVWNPHYDRTQYQTLKLLRTASSYHSPITK